MRSPRMLREISVVPPPIVPPTRREETLLQVDLVVGAERDLADVLGPAHLVVRDQHALGAEQLDDQLEHPGSGAR